MKTPKKHSNIGINRDIFVGVKVLEKEIEGLEALKNALDEKFTAAIELIFSTKGRVIISGMGKSGHVARKIAATFSSTGTPAVFVHPGEASHGDLGMITRNDVVILLSNSGETSELKDIINYTKRFSISLIGIVRRKTSALVNASDVALILPETSEASPVGAPTTSTTMMMALGDAMAVALMERKGFKSSDFHIFHPGGKIGQSFIKVESIMKKGNGLPISSENESLKDALITMSEKGLGCLAIINSRKEIVGVITDGDLRRHLRKGVISKSSHMKVRDVMTKNPIIIRPTALASEALGIMNAKNITCLFVSTGKSLEGIIHIHDILRAGIN
mgnify:CR=1 FL=1